MSQSVAVDLQELILAYEFASCDGPVEGRAYVCKTTGKTYLVSDDLGLDDEVPEGIEESDDFLPVPDKRELNLGHSLVFAFVNDKLADDVDLVEGYFRGRGAYGRFKAHLERRGLLNEWYKFEEDALTSALRGWCGENGLALKGG